MTVMHVYRPAFVFVQRYVWQTEPGTCAHDRRGTTACSHCWPKLLRGGVLLETSED